MPAAVVEIAVGQALDIQIDGRAFELEFQAPHFRLNIPFPDSRTLAAAIPPVLKPLQRSTAIIS